MSYLAAGCCLASMLVRFKEVPVGARFEFRGLRYEKVARSMARDEERQGNIFHEDTEVVYEAPAGRMTPETSANLPEDRADEL